MHQRVATLLRQVVVGNHILKHNVTSAQAVLWVSQWIVICSGLEHAYQHGSLLCGEVLGSGVEIGLCSRLNTEGIRAEVYGVGIHRDNLFLGEYGLKLGGDNPLLALDNENLQARHLPEQSRRVLRAYAEHVLCQLLSDG